MNSDSLASQVKWVWWDLDDTLWDFKANSRIALEDVYSEFNLIRIFPTVEAWCAAYLDTNHKLWGQYNVGAIDMATLRMERFRRPFVEAGLTDADARSLSAAMDGAYLRRLGEKDGLVSGAREVLDYLRAKGYEMGIISNGFSDVQYNKLATSAIADYFKYVVLSDAVGINKPDPGIFAYSSSLAGVNPRECVMIGDNPSTDIIGARNSGWHTILYDPEDKYTAEGIRIGTLEELCRLL